MSGFSIYAYANPTVYVDPDGNVVETAWDIANIGMGIASFGTNIVAGNYLGAAVDAVGVVADTVAAVIPGAPGGAGSAIKASRGAKAARDASRATNQAKKGNSATKRHQARNKRKQNLEKNVQKHQQSSKPQSKTKFTKENASGPGSASNTESLRGKTGKYKDLKKETANTKYTPDHQPSHRALVEDFERKKGGKATKQEIDKLKEEGNCVVIERCAHTKSSETFGGRNRSKDESGRRKYERDADDFEKAVDSNMDALDDTLKKDSKWTQQELSNARKQLHLKNKDGGIY